MRRFAIVIAACMLMGGVAMGADSGKGFRVTGSGEAAEIDPESLQPRLKEGYALFRRACTQCHSQERVIFVLRNCKSRFSDDVFCENSLKVKIGRMVRQPGTGISKEDGRVILEFLLELRKMVTG